MRQAACGTSSPSGAYTKNLTAKHRPCHLGAATAEQIPNIFNPLELRPADVVTLQVSATIGVLAVRGR
jgi:hypothetical protein